MLQLVGTGDYVAVFVLAAGSGMFGGLAAELLLSRNGESGSFELPARRDGTWDLGGFGRVIVGAVVGLAVLAVVQPETTVTTNGTATTTTRAYDVIRLVATAIVAGSAGGSVLTALQSTALAALNESRVQSTVAASEQQLEVLARVAKTEAAAATAATAAMATSAPEALRSARPRGVGAGPPREAPLGQQPEAAAALEAAAPLEQMSAALDRHVEEAKAAVSAAARRRR